MSKASQGQGDRLLRKCIELLDDRLGFKTKRAILLVDTDFGTFRYQLRDDPRTFQLVLGYFNERINQVAAVQYGHMLINCDYCSATGLVWFNSVSQTCDKCNGGGQVIVIQPKSPDKMSAKGEQDGTD